MNAALELIHIIEARGGQFLIAGEQLGIQPGDVATPLLEQLRANKAAIIALLRSRTAKPEQDVDELGLWLLDRCCFRDRSWTLIAALHLDHARWCKDHERPVPASRRAFERALQAEGFTVTDGWCYGLLFKADVLAMEPKKSKSNDSTLKVAKDTAAKTVTEQRGSTTEGSAGDAVTRRGAGKDSQHAPHAPTAASRAYTRPDGFPTFSESTEGEAWRQISTATRPKHICMARKKSRGLRKIH